MAHRGIGLTQLDQIGTSSDGVVSLLKRLPLTDVSFKHDEWFLSATCPQYVPNEKI